MTGLIATIVSFILAGLAILGLVPHQQIQPVPQLLQSVPQADIMESDTTAQFAKRATVDDISFVVPSGWRHQEDGSYASPDYALAPVPEHFEEGASYNPVLSGAKIIITDDGSTPVVSNIDSSDAYADFSLFAVKDCSNCRDTHKTYIDGVPSAFIQAGADYHGGSTSVEGRINHRMFRISILYANSYDKVKNVFEKLLQSIKISHAESDGQLQPSAVSVPGMSKYTDADFGFSFWYPSGWHVDIEPGGAPDFPRGIFLTNASGTKMLGMRICCAIKPPKPLKRDNFFDTTMGGLHILPCSCDQDIKTNVIVPLNPNASVSILRPADGMLDVRLLAKTILATDLSVATPVSAAEQIKTIQAERQAYAGQ